MANREKEVHGWWADLPREFTGRLKGGVEYVQYLKTWGRDEDENFYDRKDKGRTLRWLTVDKG